MNTQEQDEVIKSAQYRKGLSIAFFNATNNAAQIIEMIYREHPQTNMDVIKKDIATWRDWLLEEHKNYYARVIANVGQKYNSQDTIKKLKTAKNLDELKSMWVGLSEDERRDGEIIKEVQELKKLYA